MKIFTITLSPAYDIHAQGNSFELHSENFAKITSCDAGGKGINISRSLAYNGVQNTAIAVLGNENCTDFRNALNRENVNLLEILKDGRIRENITLHIRGEKETRLSFSGFSVNCGVLSEIEELIDTGEECIVTFTGSVPDEIEIEDAKAFLKRLKERGAKIVIDSRSFSTDDILSVKPWLIKPNGEEISAYLKKEVRGFEDCMDFAKRTVSDGVENVMISLGEFGALLATKQKLMIATPPKIAVKSSVGAGDSTIAGFISAYVKGKSDEECLKTAVAFGSAACLREGTTPPLNKDVEAIYSNIKLIRLN